VNEISLRIPEWVLPPKVHAYVTTREGGHSMGPWQGFNLGLHVQDDTLAVQQNRMQLLDLLQHQTGLPELSLQWVQQVHGTDVLRVEQPESGLEPPPQADAIYSRKAGIACGVLTADCLPVLFCSNDGEEIAVAHAGWRGLAAGVLERTLACFQAAPAGVRVWLGPAIGPCHFEVGADVKTRFLAESAVSDHARIERAFVSTGRAGKYLADLYQLARLRLNAAGVQQISGTPCCTACDSSLWYSYRREPQTGRFATLILKTR
jgi:YfiH family protein